MASIAARKLQKSIKLMTSTMQPVIIATPAAN